MRTALAWIVRAGERRPSRIHDYDRRPVAIAGTVDIPVVLWQAWRRRLLGRRPALPWIPYPAIRRLRKLIEPHWRVLEMGSGNSTVWLAARVSEIRSVESDRSWYAYVSSRLAERALSARYTLVDVASNEEQYWQLQPGEQHTYDLAFVDGLFRDQCVHSAVNAIREGGYVYLDNIDTEGRSAFSLLSREAEARGRPIELFTGFPPAQPTVTTGALAQL
jgi:predicted O-methyltransferase YrrM